MSADFLKRDSWKSHGVGDEFDDNGGVPVRPITEAGLSRMGRQKKELTSQMVGATKEIEELRLRQKELEQEKQDIEESAKQQEEYEIGKRDIIDKLNRGVVMLEKEESQALRMCELLSETRIRFKKTLEELSEIDEDSWPDEKFRVELNRATVMVDMARGDYKKAMAKIDASSWHKGLSRKLESEAVKHSEDLEVSKGFGHWLGIGIAVSLPLMVFLSVLFVLWLYLRS